MFHRGFTIGSNVLNFFLNLAFGVIFLVLGVLLGIVGLVTGIAYDMLKVAVTNIRGIAMTFLLALVLWPVWNFGLVPAFSDYLVSPINYIQAYLLILAINIFAFLIPPVVLGEKLSANERILLDILRTHGAGARRPATQAQSTNFNSQPGAATRPERPVSSTPGS